MIALPLVGVLLMLGQTAPKPPAIPVAKKTARPRKVRARASAPKTSAATELSDAIPLGTPQRMAVRAVTPAVSSGVRLSTLVQISRQVEAPEPPAFENAEGLAEFFHSLASSQTTPGPVHILEFGDSHTASDDLPNAIRMVLQTRFGAGGPGFAHAGRPFRGYRRFDVSGSNSKGWIATGTLKSPSDGYDGLSGVSITSQTAGETVTLTTAADTLELHYLRQPGGGSFQFLVDSVAIDTVSTDGATEAAFYQFTPTPGTHEFTVRTVSSAPVRLFGWSSDCRQGVTVETLGINGAQSSMLLNWNPTVWQTEVARRNPALVILQYGTNEANSPKMTAPEFAADLGLVIERVRAAAPGVSILLIGPPDCGRLKPLRHLDEVIETQRQVARSMGVAYWNWRERMGGPGSVSRWVRAGLGQGDYIHMTGEGYRLVGKMLTDDLGRAFDAYLAPPNEASRINSHQ